MLRVSNKLVKLTTAKGCNKGKGRGIESQKRKTQDKKGSLISTKTSLNQTPVEEKQINIAYTVEKPRDETRDEI